MACCKTCVRLLVILVTVSMAVLFPSSMAFASGPTLDLTLDADGDNIPDALARELESIYRAKDPQVAIASLVDRLPYSPRTRDLQHQAEAIIASLGQARSPEEFEKLNLKLLELSEQMMADPNYARAVNALQRLAEKETGLDKVAMAAVPSGTSWTASLRRGDIMFVGGPQSWWTYIFWAMRYSHAGNYDGNSFVYESNLEGVRRQPLRNWLSRGLLIGLGRNNKRSQAGVTSALDWAQGRWGTDGRTKYNFNLADKYTDSRLYCSQLVWKVHQRTGVDLDSNAPAYLAYIYAKWRLAGYLVALSGVAPDEIAMSPNVSIYYTGWN